MMQELAVMAQNWMKMADFMEKSRAPWPETAVQADWAWWEKRWRAGELRSLPGRHTLARRWGWRENRVRILLLEKNAALRDGTSALTRATVAPHPYLPESPVGQGDAVELSRPAPAVTGSSAGSASPSTGGSSLPAAEPTGFQRATNGQPWRSGGIEGPSPSPGGPPPQNSRISLPSLNSVVPARQNPVERSASSTGSSETVTQPSLRTTRNHSVLIEQSPSNPTAFNTVDRPADVVTLPITPSQVPTPRNTTESRPEFNAISTAAQGAGDRALPSAAGHLLKSAASTAPPVATSLPTRWNTNAMLASMKAPISVPPVAESPVFGTEPAILSSLSSFSSHTLSTESEGRKEQRKAQSDDSPQLPAVQELLRLLKRWSGDEAPNDRRWRIDPAQDANWFRLEILPTPQAATLDLVTVLRDWDAYLERLARSSGTSDRKKFPRDWKTALRGVIERRAKWESEKRMGSSDGADPSRSALSSPTAPGSWPDQARATGGRAEAASQSSSGKEGTPAGVSRGGRTWGRGAFEGYFAPTIIRAGG